MKKSTYAEELISLYMEKQSDYGLFMNNVRNFFEFSSSLIGIVHSVKMRLKDPEHLREKIKRKRRVGRVIDETNLFDTVTDLAGVRVLHLHQDQFIKIHQAIKQQVEDGEWVFVEEPTVYTWDPDSKDFFKSLGMDTKVKDSHYTSIHYVIRPNKKHSFVTCEIQVRTLFDEIWGEIDHTINYPHPTDSVACKEELRVLAKLTSTGSRLADAIFRSYEEYLQLRADEKTFSLKTKK